MNQHSRLCGMACLAALTAGLLAARPVAAADEAMTADRLLPANTYAYFSIPDVTEFKQKFRDSVYGEMRRDENLKPFWDQVEALLQMGGRQIEQELGVTAKELLQVPSGQFAVAAVPIRGSKLGVVALLDFGQSEETVDRLLDLLADKLDQDEITRTVEEIDDTRVVVYTWAQEEGEKQPFKQLAYFVKDQTLVVGSELLVLQEVLKRWGSEGDASRTLADSAVYTEIREQTHPETGRPLFSWYVDPIGLVKAGMMLAAQEQPGVMLAFTFLPALGLDKFKAVGGAADLSVEDFVSVSRTMLYVDQPTTAVLNLFQFPVADLSPPKWVSAGTDSYFAANWDVQTAFEAVQGLYDTFPGFGQGPGAFEDLLDQVAQDDPGIHPKKDVIDLLTGKILVVGDVPEPTGESDEGEGDDAAAQSYLVAVGVKDEKKAGELLAKIAELEETNFETREFEGKTVYEVEAPTPQGGPTTVSLAVADGYLIITNDPAALEGVISDETDRKPLAQSPAYQRIAKHFPKQTSMLSYQRQDVQAEAAYEMLRSGELFPQADEIDLSALPEYEDIREYLPTVGSYTVPVEHGALMVSFSVRNKPPVKSDK